MRLRRLTERSATALYCYKTRSFGTQLNPRYIFGADALDQ